MSPTVEATREVAFRAARDGGARLRGELYGTPPTAREIEGLRAVASPVALGRRSLHVAAAALGISPHTVDKHLRTVRERLGVRTTTEAIWMLREQLA